MFVFKIPDMRKLFFFRDNIINKKDTITTKNAWRHKPIDPMNMSPWKISLLSYLQKYGGDKISNLKK
jgi:hypothetical protein